MQRTRLDYWIRARYVHVYEVLANSLPKPMPHGIEIREIGQTVGGMDWNYSIWCEDESAYHRVIEILRRNRSIYLPKVTRRTGILVRLLDPPRGQSFTYNMVWHVLRIIAMIALTIAIPIGQLVSHASSYLRGLLHGAEIIRRFFVVGIISCAFGPTMAAQSEPPEDLAEMVVKSLNDPIFAEWDTDPLPSEPGFDRVPLPGDWASPRTYIVTRKVVVTPQETFVAETEEGEQEISALRTGGMIRLHVGGRTMEYQIYDESKAIVENALQEGIAAMLDSIKGVRIGNNRLETVALTERTILISTTAFRRDDVLVTYGRRKDANFSSILHP